MTRKISPSRILPIVLMSISFFSRAAAPTGATDEIRAIWITRWDYLTPQDIKIIMTNVTAYGYNRVYFQVRGDGTLFYPSSVEPWACELSGGDLSRIGHNPGWDPLACAIAEAHRQGVELHAYLNVLPGWNQKKQPPRTSGHLYVTRPDWFMVDDKGHRMSPERHDFYAFLNPARADVRAHLVRVFGEIAQRYKNLDGIHYDYIRYPGEAGEFSHDPVTIADFKKHSRGLEPEQIPELWIRYRCYLIDLLAAEITTAIRKANPKIEVSAAVIADYEGAVNNKGQCWLTWPERYYVDTLVPMTYCYDMNNYKKYLDISLGASRAKRGKTIIGVWPAEKWEKEGLTPQRLGQQIALARAMGADGIALFSYGELFPEHKANKWARYLKTYCFSGPDKKIAARNK